LRRRRFLLFRDRALLRVPLLLHPPHRGTRDPPSNKLPGPINCPRLLERRHNLPPIARRQCPAHAAPALASRYGPESLALHQSAKQANYLRRDTESFRDVTEVRLRLLAHRDQKHVALGCSLRIKRPHQATAHEHAPSALFIHNDAAPGVEPRRRRAGIGQGQGARCRLSHRTQRRPRLRINSHNRPGPRWIAAPAVLRGADQTAVHAARTLALADPNPSRA